MPETDASDVRTDAAPDPDALEARAAELEDQRRRALADLDNMRKRFGREVERERAAERARVAASWLPVVDHLELALEHAGVDPASIVEGVRAVRDQAVALLAALGFPRDEAVGELFDPNRHEAITAVAAPDVTPGTVLHVVRPGYGGNDTQLRPASVVVATRPD